MVEKNTVPCHHRPQEGLEHKEAHFEEVYLDSHYHPVEAEDSQRDHAELLADLHNLEDCKEELEVH